MMALLTRTAELDRFCRKARKHPFVAVDTEFMGERKYFPKLCLVQLAMPGDFGETALVDVLAPTMKLDSLHALLSDNSVVKVFHSAKQDIEIFYRQTEQIPSPIFDTQLAAMVCGFGHSVAYATLVRRLASARIDKSARFADWSKRPLAAKQMAYALSDVTYLRIIYLKLKETLEENGRSAWVDDEIRILTAPETYRIDVDQAWRRMKLAHISADTFSVVKELAKLREQLAQQLDVPRRFLLSDSGLISLAGSQPRSSGQLKRVRFAGNSQLVRKFGTQAMAAVQAGLSRKNQKGFPVELEPRIPTERDASNMLRLLRKIIARDVGVAEQLLASSDDIQAIVTGDMNARPLLGWRREVFGARALQLCRGEIALTLSNSKFRIVDLESEH